MLKKLKYLIMASIVILLFSSTTVIAYEDEGFSRDGEKLKYQDKILDTHIFSELISNGNKSATSSTNLFRGSFIRVNPEFLLGTKLKYYYTKKPPIYNKAFSCIAHNYSNVGGDMSTYTITNVVDIVYDENRKSVVINTYSKDGLNVADNNDAKYIAGEISAAIKKNDIGGTGVNDDDYWKKINNNETVYGMWTPYKNAVEIFLGEGINRGVIKANPIYEQVWDTEEEAKIYSTETAMEKFKEDLEYTDTGENYFDVSAKNASEFIEMEANNNAIPEEKKHQTINNKDYLVIGPFKMKFNQGNGINIININNNKIEKIEDKKVYWTKNYTNNDWNENWRAIEPNQSFYLAVDNTLLPSGNNDYDVEFTQKPLYFTEARMVMLESEGVQQWGAFTSYDMPKEIKGSVKYTITHKANGKITIEKVDAKDESIKLQGVKLKLYGDLDNGNRGWVAEGVKGSKTVASYYGAAIEFVTGTDRNCKH